MTPLRQMLSIAAFEARSSFLSFVGCAAVAVYLALVGYAFFSALTLYAVRSMQFLMAREIVAEQFNSAQMVMVPCFQQAAMALLLLVPVLTMGTLAEERRSGTLVLYLTAPLGAGSVVMGKFLGLLVVLATALLLTLPLPLSLAWVGEPDFWPVLSGYVGLGLLAAAFGAVGLAISAGCSSQAVAAALTFGILGTLWSAGRLADLVDGPLAAALRALSLSHHFTGFPRGVFQATDVVFPLLLAGVALAFAAERIAAERVE